MTGFDEPGLDRLAQDDVQHEAAIQAIVASAAESTAELLATIERIRATTAEWELSERTRHAMDSSLLHLEGLAQRLRERADQNDAGRD